MRRTFGAVTVECVMGDITSQDDVEAVVNAANARLEPGGGVAGAIHRASGPGLAEEAVPLGPIQPGEAVITGAHRLPNRYVVHTLGPVYGQDRPEAELLGGCYRNSLALAEEYSVGSIAFPAISTGVYRWPMDDAARIAVSNIGYTWIGRKMPRAVSASWFISTAVPSSRAGSRACASCIFRTSTSARRRADSVPPNGPSSGRPRSPGRPARSACTASPTTA